MIAHAADRRCSECCFPWWLRANRTGALEPKLGSFAGGKEKGLAVFARAIV